MPTYENRGYALGDSVGVKPSQTLSGTVRIFKKLFKKVGMICGYVWFFVILYGFQV